MRKIITALVVIVAILALVIAFGGKKSSKESSASPSPSTATSASPSSSASPTAAAATIAFTSSGFSPATVTVASGGQVTFKNSSSQTIQVDSDPHPVHTDNTELNIGTIAPGESKTATLTKKGTWGYHDHLDPSMTGHITVQ